MSDASNPPQPPIGSAEALWRLRGSIRLIHDLQRTVASLAGCLTRLREHAPSPADADVATLGRIVEDAGRLARAFDEVVRPPADGPDFVDLGEFVRGLEPDLCDLAGDRIDVVFRLSGQPAVVRADAMELALVIASLVSCGREAMPEGGEMAVDTGWLDLVPAGAATDEVTPVRHVRLTISDTGRGLRREASARLGTACVPAAERGAAHDSDPSVATVVRRMGGWFIVESEERTGTRIHVCLPAAG